MARSTKARKPKRRLNTRLILSIVLLVGLILGNVTMAYQLMAGERGFAAYMSLQQQQREAVSVLEKASADRITLEDRVLRMRPDSLDADLLEEQAKNMLGMAKPNEQVIILEY